MKKFSTISIYLLASLAYILLLICCCFGLGGIGVLPAALAYFMAAKGVNELNANPAAYENGPAIKRAKTFSLIALILTGLLALYTMYRFSTTTAEQRKEETIRLMRDADVDDKQIDQIEPYLF